MNGIMSGTGTSMLATWIIVQVELLLVALAWLVGRSPRWRTDGRYFGWFVPVGFPESEAGRAVARQFRRRVGWTALAAMAVAAAPLAWLTPAELSLPGWLITINLAPLVAVSIAWSWAMASARSRVRPFSIQATEAAGIAVTTAPDHISASAAATAPPLPSGWGWRLLRLGPVLIVAAAVLYLNLRWNEIPERYPIHWNAAGVVDGWSGQDWSSVAGPLLIALFIAGFSQAITLIALKATPSSFHLPAAAVLERRARRCWEAIALLLAYFVTLLMAGTVAWLPFRGGSSQMPGGLIAGAVVGGFIMTVGIFLLISQGSELLTQARKLEPAAGPLLGAIIQRQERRFWKWGMFYYNPEDPAVWVEKRFGAGWTTNMAHRQSWYYLAATIGFVGVVIGLALLIG